MVRHRYHRRKRRPVRRRRATFRRRGRYTTARRGRGTRANAPFPTARYVTLRYSEQISLDPTAAGFAVHEFKSNGLYDPNVTGTGHQPRGYDQLMGIYNRWCVVGSSITVKPVQTPAANYFISLAHSNTPNPASGETSLREFTESSLCLAWRSWLNGAQDPKDGVLHGKVRCSKFFRAQVTKEADYWGAISSDPNIPSYWSVYCQDAGGGDPVALALNVFLTYRVKFFEPIKIDES